MGRRRRVGAVISDSDLVGGRYKDVGNFLQGGGPVGRSVHGGDMGTHSKDGAGPGQFSKQGCEEDHR